MVPTLWVTYGLVLVFGTNLDRSAIALTLLSMPVFSYIGIVVAEAGMVDWKDLKPFWMRLFPSTRRRLAALPGTRKRLQEDLRKLIRSIGPDLGDLYYVKDLDWTTVQKQALRKESGEEEESKKAK